MKRLHPLLLAVAAGLCAHAQTQAAPTSPGISAAPASPAPSNASISAVLPAPAAQTQPLTAAVLDFQSSEPELEKKGAQIAILLNARLSAADNLVLVERQELDKILGEQELGISGSVTPESAAQIGQLTGAKVLVTGRVFGSMGKYFAVAKIIGTETGRVYGEVSPFGALDGLDQAANKLAAQICELLEKRGDTLLARVESPQGRLARLRALVSRLAERPANGPNGRTLPSVSVEIREEHLARAAANTAVPDPAAQTEMKLLLRQLGFEVVEREAQKAADVLITGEAFSERAGQHGGLISCRARVEMKAMQAATGKLLLADRQSDIAVDLAEGVAAKAALQNAAARLVERLLPAVLEPKVEP